VTAVVTSGAGFLLAVLWFDLMFDVQVLRHRGRAVPEEVLASISAYYRRVTTTARPLNRLVAAAMLVTLTAIAAQLARGDVAPWVGWGSLALGGIPTLLAAVHTVPAAVRLGSRADEPEVQGRLARTICRDHLLCLAGIAGLLAWQLSFAQ
jgi:hypothetical protein